MRTQRTSGRPITLRAASACTWSALCSRNASIQVPSCLARASLHGASMTAWLDSRRRARAASQAMLAPVVTK
jgi:hypothetical protein